jgi:type IV pilus modification protein PilV
MDRQRGFNLVEVMVALVVLSLGMLGIAGLQLSSIRNTQSAYYRSQAVASMNDLAERIYANAPGARSGQYNKSDSSTANFCAATPKICTRESSAVAASACNSTEMATYDLAVSACGQPDSSGARRGGVNGLLPSGSITTVACGGAASCPQSSPITIIVRWSDRGSSGSTDAKAQGQLSSQLVSMVIQP